VRQPLQTEDEQDGRDEICDVNQGRWHSAFSIFSDPSPEKARINPSF
jgi:hypothetical protein